MTVAIMQPYFMPYIGYFQLMKSADIFVVYDNIKYTKKGWINRNRILVNGSDEYITLPLKKDSDDCFVIQRSLSDSWPVEREKLINKVSEVYRKAPYYKETIELFKHCIYYEERNLFRFIFNSINIVKDYLLIGSRLIVSSDLTINHELKGEEKVIAIAAALGADCYVNPPGGVDLYTNEHFEDRKIELRFLQPETFTYQQFDNVFIPWLSIIDVLMFNDPEYVQTILINNYNLYKK